MKTKNNFFKKYIVFAVLIAVISVLLAGCGFIFSPRPSTNQNDESYKISLYCEDASIKAEDFLSGSKLVKPVVDPRRVGYEFVGWYSDKDLTKAVEFDVELTADITIYSKWKKLAFVATFVLLDGSEDKQIAAVDGKFVPPAAEREGYEFKGWYRNADLKGAPNDFWVATGDMSFFAKWEAVKYTISYDCDGLASVSLQAKYQYTVADDDINLRDPVNIEAGYRFKGWFTDEETVVTKIPKGSIGDIKLKAKFESSNKKLLSYGALNVNETKKEATVGIKYSTTETSLEFKDVIKVSPRATYTVYSGNTAVTETATLVENVPQEFTVIVTAENKENQSYSLRVIMYDASNVSVNYHYAAGDVRTDWVSKGEIVSMPATKEKTGYEFAGWYTEQDYRNLYDFNLMVTDHIDIYAKYDLKQYHIYYNTGTWKTNENATEQFDITQKVELLPPQTDDPQTRYEFVCWKNEIGNRIEEIASGTAKDVALYAEYTLKTDYRSAAIDGGFIVEQEITIDRLADYFDWCIWGQKMTSIPVLVYAPKSETQGVDNYIGKKITEYFKNSDRSTVVQTADSFTMQTGEKTENGVVYVKYQFTYEVGYIEPSVSAAEKDKYEQLSYTMHEFTSTRAVDFDGFAIDMIKDKVEVSDSDELYCAAVRGYCPVPTAGSSAYTIYQKAKGVLRKIVDDGMTDTEKAHAIYDWLILETAYDHDLLALAGSGTKTHEELKAYNGFALEGIFNDKRAVCDGISKAFALMCNIEGIECVQVVGEKVDGEGHAWNKVKIGGKWYNVDPTSGGLVLKSSATEGFEVISHAYFMVTDEVMGLMNIPDDETVNGHKDKIADTDYNVYADMKFTYNSQERDCVIRNASEWQFVGQYMKSIERNTVFDFKIAYDTNETSLRNAISNSVAGNTVSVSYNGSTGTVIVIIK